MPTKATPQDKALFKEFLTLNDECKTCIRLFVQYAILYRDSVKPISPLGYMLHRAEKDFPRRQ